MKKRSKVLVAALVLVILALAVSTAFAAPTDAQKKEIDEIYQKMVELQKQLIQKYVDAGLITPDQAAYMIDRMNLMLKYRNNFGLNRGFGPMGGGMMGGFGPGGWFCPMHGGSYGTLY